MTRLRGITSEPGGIIGAQAAVVSEFEILDVHRIRVDTLKLPELGFLENIEKVDGQTLRIAFVATTEEW